MTKAQASSILNRIFSQKSNIKTWDNPDYRKVEIRKKTETISQTRDYYVVFEGRQRGVFRDWESCKAQISGYQNALYRRFTSKEAADQALKKYRVNKRTIRQVHMDNTDFLWK